MLKRLRVKNFRLLRDIELVFEDQVPTVLVGPNASGKSTVLEVLDFLKRCAADGLNDAVIAHGGFDSIRTAGVAAPIEIESEWIFETSEGWPNPRRWFLDWSFKINRSHAAGPLVEEESLFDGKDERTGIVTTGPAGNRKLTPLGAEKVSRPSHIQLHELAFEAGVDRDRYPALWVLRHLVAETQVIAGVTPAPTWARAIPGQPSPRDSLVIGPRTFLDRQGLGLANALYTLSTEETEAWSELERAFRAEFPFVKRITFPADPGGGKIAFAFEDTRFPGRKFYASEMSDGMIVYLCLLAAVIHPTQVGVLGLDEPDANLHPSALRRLVSLAHVSNWMRNIVIVTHSNALLDELRDPARSIRIVEPSTEGATIRTLDADALSAWREEYTLSEMRRTGLIDSPNAAAGTDG